MLCDQLLDGFRAVQVQLHIISLAILVQQTTPQNTQKNVHRDDFKVEDEPNGHQILRPKGCVSPKRSTYQTPRKHEANKQSDKFKTECCLTDALACHETNLALGRGRFRLPKMHPPSLAEPCILGGALWPSTRPTQRTQANPQTKSKQTNNGHTMQPNQYTTGAARYRNLHSE